MRDSDSYPEIAAAVSDKLKFVGHFPVVFPITFHVVMAKVRVVSKKGKEGKNSFLPSLPFLLTALSLLAAPIHFLLKNFLTLF